MTQKIVIDEEFRSLIPPLSLEEREQLEANIKADGIREPLVVWQEESILLDGHNRLEICTAHNMQYEVREISFPDRIAASEWVIKNQFGRRNLTPGQRMKLALLIESTVANRAKENQTRNLNNVGKTQFAANGVVSVDLRKRQIHTDEELGKMAGVGETTAYRARVVHEKGSPELQEKVFTTGEMSVNQAYEKVTGKMTKQRSQPTVEPEPAERKVLGVGVTRANEAINSLMRIPKNDKLRERGFQIVTDWIRRNK